MNLLDLALLLFVAGGTLAGLVSGFVKAAANLIGLVLGFVLGSVWFPVLAPLFLRLTGKVAVAGLLSFTVIALGVALVLDALGGLGTSMVRLLRMQIVNRPLGLIPAGISAILIAGVALAVLNGFRLLESERAESRVAGWILDVSAPVIDLLPPPWNGTPRELPRPIPTGDAPQMARARVAPRGPHDCDSAASRARTHLTTIPHEQ